MADRKTNGLENIGFPYILYIYKCTYLYNNIYYIVYTYIQKGESIIYIYAYRVPIRVLFSTHTWGRGVRNKSEPTEDGKLREEVVGGEEKEEKKIETQTNTTSTLIPRGRCAGYAPRCNKWPRLIRRTESRKP